MLDDIHAMMSMAASAGGLGAYQVDSEGTILHWSQSAEKLFGYTEAEMLGNSVYTLIPCEHHGGFAEFVSRLEHQSCLKVHSTRRKKCGATFLALITACRLQSIGNNGVIVVLVRDEGATKEEARFAELAASIVMSSTDAIASVDASGHVLTWNAAATRLFGYSAAEMVGQSMRPLFPPQRQWARGMGASELAQGRSLMHDTVRIHKDGREIPVSLVASPLIDGEGTYLGYSVIFRSATDKAKSVAAARDAERFNERVLVASNDWISVISLSGTLMYINPAGMKVLDRNDDPTANNANWISLWQDKDRSFVEAHLSLAIGGTATRFDADIVTVRGRTVALDVTITPIVDENGIVVRVLAIAHDETEKREQRAHLNLVVRELSHRVKNLLAVISGMARSSSAEDGDVQTFQKNFHARIRSLAKSHDLLVGVDWRGLDIAELLRSQVSAFGVGTHDRRITLSGPTTILRPEPAQMLGLAFHELATNAAKYGALADAGGKLDIFWERTVAEQGGEALRFIWQESVPGKISPAKRTGFGSEVLNELVAEMLGGESSLSFGDSSVTWTLNVSCLAEIASADDAAVPIGAPEAITAPC